VTSKQAMCFSLIDSNASADRATFGGHKSEILQLVHDKNGRSRVDTSFWGQPSTFSRDYDKRTWAEVPLLLLKADQGGLLGRQCDASNAGLTSKTPCHYGVKYLLDCDNCMIRISISRRDKCVQANQP